MCREKNIQSLWSRSDASWKSWLTESEPELKARVVGQVCPKFPESVRSTAGRQRLCRVCALQHLQKEPAYYNCCMGHGHWCSGWPVVLSETLDKRLNMAKSLKLKFCPRKREIWRCGITFFFFGKLRCVSLAIKFHVWFRTIWLTFSFLQIRQLIIRRTWCTREKSPQGLWLKLKSWHINYSSWS